MLERSQKSPAIRHKFCMSFKGTYTHACKTRFTKQRILKRKQGNILHSKMLSIHTYLCDGAT